MKVTTHSVFKAILLFAGRALSSTLASAGQSPEVVWGQQLGTADEDFGGAIAVDARGACWIAGATKSRLGEKSAGGTDVVVARFDATGKKTWVAQFGTQADERA